LIGRRIADQLIAAGNWEVIGLARRPPPAQSMRWIAVDLTDCKDCRRKLDGLAAVTHVFYAARFDRRGRPGFGFAAAHGRPEARSRLGTAVDRGPARRGRRHHRPGYRREIRRQGRVRSIVKYHRQSRRFTAIRLRGSVYDNLVALDSELVRVLVGDPLGKLQYLAELRIVRRHDIRLRQVVDECRDE